MQQILTGLIDFRRDLTEDTYEIDVELRQPLHFEAGQFISIQIPQDNKFILRAYSICSSPKDPNIITICIKKIPGGIGSNYLYDIPIGTEIKFLGPFGEFILEEGTIQQFYFIATGTGVAPFMSIIDTHLAKYPEKKFHLIFGVRFEKDLLYRDILNVYKRNYKNFSYDLCLSKAPDDFIGFKGRVTKKILAIDFNAETYFYICGNGSMVEDTKHILLKQKNVDISHIFHEKYNNI